MQRIKNCTTHNLPHIILIIQNTLVAFALSSFNVHILLCQHQFFFFCVCFCCFSLHALFHIHYSYGVKMFWAKQLASNTYTKFNTANEFKLKNQHRLSSCFFFTGSMHYGTVDSCQPNSKPKPLKCICLKYFPLI